MEELQNISTYEAFKAATDKEVLNQAEGFVRLGYLLRRARDTEILKDSGYLSVVEFAEAEYGLTETYVSRYIAINKRYSEDGYSPYLMERFRGYGVAKLAEMLTLSEEVVEALPPELPKAAIQEVKREIRQEQEKTDLEVMLEEEDAGSEGKNNLEKWLLVYVRENREEWLRGKAHGPGTDPEGWVMDVLAPTGIAAKMARIKGAGKFMLTIKSRYLPIELVNLRTNEKETYSLEECASIMESIRMQELEDEQGKKKTGLPENEKENEKIAPVQEREPEKEMDELDDYPAEGLSRETDGHAEETEISHGEEAQEQVRQMKVEDYPDILPEGYVSSSAYIHCHDGSEVMPKGEKEAEALIGELYKAVSQTRWEVEEVYRKAEELVGLLKNLREAER